MLLEFQNALNIKIARFLTNRVFKMDDYPYVAMFHDIVSNHSEDKYSYPIEDYERYIKSISNRIVTASYDKCKQLKNGTIVTFDDGFSSIITSVLPIMEKYHKPFILFVATSLIGQEGYLTWEELSILANNPLCKIGSHSVNHVKFRSLTKQQVMQELTDSKDILESRLGIKVEDFAFPYGSMYAVSSDNISDAKKVYTNVFTTKPVTIFRDREYIPRLNMPYFLRRNKAQ